MDNTGLMVLLPAPATADAVAIHLLQSQCRPGFCGKGCCNAAKQNFSAKAARRVSLAF
jgi:hypothetical protein